ncbi:OsmC family protein [Terriglobus sp. ADX1]|uniref:OsmC family protein n=1 Tax=Terriglobus sp. ADX1 TaxID=2794063 RepID=UPI002FE6171B
MKNEHHYNTSIVWTGNRGTGTSSYRDYARSYDLTAPGKPLIAGAGISVIAYSDNAEGTMQLNPDGSGHFTSVTLHPQVTIATGHDLTQADALHHRAHELCFIANSVNFPVACEATTAHAANDSRDI